MDLYSPTAHALAQPNGHALPPELPLPHPQPNPPPAPAFDLGAHYAAELPSVQEGLVPLSFIVERVVSQAHHELANLAETLPHSQDQARKRAIVDYVLQTRRQILKLLVLVRWSSEADNINKCMNIVGFLGRQNFEFDNSVNSLTEVKGMLAGARVRNSDLPTSLSVLRTGNYSRLPSIIVEGFSQPERLSDEVVLKTLEELDGVLRWRLGCREQLPRGMSRYWIADGRAYFTVEGMWEASFTFGGGEDDEDDSPSKPEAAQASTEEGASPPPPVPPEEPNLAQWFLLSLKFLFRVRDARGVWSNTPTGPMKEHIIELCNRELARRPAAAAEGAKEEGVKPPKRDAPLVRGYNFLQRLALTYQLESLHQQAAQLAATSWSGNLRIEMNKERTELKVGYWCSPKPEAPPAPSRNQSVPPAIPSPPPSLIFSIGPASSSSAASASASQADARMKALERVLEYAAGVEESEEVEDSLRIEWSAEGLDEVRREAQLALDSDLSLEGLLLRLTTLHARDTIVQLYHHLASSGDFKEEDLELVPSSSTANATLSSTLDLPTIRLHLFSAHSVVLALNPLSGKLEFRAPGEVSNAREARLRNAAEKVNAAPGGQLAAAGETLLRVRASTILDEVESRALYLGLQTTRRLPLRGVDLARFGEGTRSCLFVKLRVGDAGKGAGAPSHHYLVLVMTEVGFRFALMGAREGSDQMQCWLGIGEVGWLERGGVGRKEEVEGGEWGAAGQGKGKEREGEQKEAMGFDVTVEDLREVHSYCVRRIAYLHIEQQLHLRRIPYRTSSSSTSSAHTLDSTEVATIDPITHVVPSLATETPYLVLNSLDLLKASALPGAGGASGSGVGRKVAYPNVAITCVIKGEVVKTSLSLRLHSFALAGVEAELQKTTSSGMTFDPKSHVITFTSDELDQCIAKFLGAYSIIMRSIVLAQHRKSELLEQEKENKVKVENGVGDVLMNGV